jgi:fructuronate reductase
VFEQRKLWLLNGSHSQLAYAGSVLGHATIDQAIDDADCRHWVETFWDEASRHLEFSDAEIDEYRQALLTRFANPRVGDQLARIAADGSQKLRVRTVPAALAERAAGRLPEGCATTFAAWVLHLQGRGAPISDAGADAARAAAATDDLTEAVRGVLRTLEPALADDDEFVAAVVGQAGLLTSRA